MTEAPNSDALSARRAKVVPLIVAAGLLIENLDATVLATAIPTMARDFDVNPIHLKLAMTSYLLALAVFIPASGWVADRFGGRKVFCAAMVVFAAGSICCALSNSLTTIVAARIFQGVGGAMLVPVARLVVLRSVKRTELVGAMALLAMPALLGPVVGPPIGGFITTYASWHWIFWINVPIAAIGIVLATMYIDEVRAEHSPPFDLRGFALVGPGLAALLGAVSLLGLDHDVTTWIWVLGITGVVLLALYTRHALLSGNALIDLRLLSLPTFRQAIVGGFLFRVGVGATPFLLPLMLQVGLGKTAFQSGMITFVTGLGALTMKAIAPRILGRYGFRRVLVTNGVIAGVLVAAPLLFVFGTPVAVMLPLLFLGGLFRSLQFTSVNAVAYAEVSQDALGRANTFSAVLQELSGSFGIAVAAVTLQLSQNMAGGGGDLAQHHFILPFIAIAVISLAATWPFYQLAPDAGHEMTVRPTQAALVVKVDPASRQPGSGNT